MAPDLFNFGKFTLASGKISNFKIDCDALTDSEWRAIAELVAPKLPPFDVVVGVPRGGLKFADALYQHRTVGAHAILYADDVWTTGKSMRRIVNEKEPCTGIVLFARGPLPEWVQTVFSVNEKWLS